MTKTKRILAVALSGAMLLPAISMAEAGPRKGWHKHHGGHGHHRPHRGHAPKKHNNNAGAAVAAGIIGLAAGAIILGATSQRSYAAPAQTYYPPAPAPGRVHGAGYGLQPWSPAWYRYCSNKFRSFQPSTGTYTTYRGEQKFCQ
ncbi:BA14K family protein [Roseibium sp.]|uniref:BA14K family protein n=1 Tax=Roseibium sp. TaxID=1936156 RepID=UPI003262E3CD